MSSDDLAIDPAEAPDPAPGAAIERMELRLVMLGEISRLGMKLIQSLCADVADAPSGASGDRLSPEGVVAAFTKISRSVRLTIAMEMRAEDALHALRTGAVVQRAARADPRSVAGRAARAAAVTDDGDDDPIEDLGEETRAENLHERAETETEDFGDLCAIERALDALLARDPADGGVKGLPLEERARRIGVELDLIPDCGVLAGHGRTPREAPQRRRLAYDGVSGLEADVGRAAIHVASVEAHRRRLE